MEVFYGKRAQQRRYAELNVNIMPNGLVADSQILKKKGQHAFQKQAVNAESCSQELLVA